MRIRELFENNRGIFKHNLTRPIPHWATAFKLIALVRPSSAACKRVFSLLTNAFSLQQESAMEDYISLSVMLQYNY